MSINTLVSNVYLESVDSLAILVQVVHQMHGGKLQLLAARS